MGIQLLQIPKAFPRKRWLYPATGLGAFSGASVRPVPRGQMNGGGIGAFYRRGLGVGTAAGEEIGAGITAAAPATGPAAPIVAAVGVLTSLIGSFIGGGCGQACIVAAQAEQIYEYAAQCLDAVAKAGMIGQSALQNGLETLLSAGTQHMQSLNPQDSQTAAGLTNMTNAITSDLKSVGNYAATAPNALNLSTVQSLFPQLRAGTPPARQRARNWRWLTCNPSIQPPAGLPFRQPV